MLMICLVFFYSYLIFKRELTGSLEDSTIDLKVFSCFNFIGIPVESSKKIDR